MWQRIKLIAEWIFDQVIYPLVPVTMPSVEKRYADRISGKRRH